jgi:hypothetical protein
LPTPVIGEFTDPFHKNGFHEAVVLLLRVCCRRYIATSSVYRGNA